MNLQEFKSILKKDFFSNVAKLFTGTAIAQIITLSFMPLLARLYTPEEFGTFALFFSLVSTFGFVASGRYETALMLPKDTETSGRVLMISLILCFLFSSLFGLAVLVIPGGLVANLGLKEFSKISIILPFGVFITGIYQVLVFWHNKNKNFNLLAKNKIFQNSAVTAINVTGGYVHFSYGGLILGYISGQIVSIISLIRKEFHEILKIFRTNKIKSLKTELIQYKNFPLFSAPMVLLNTISINILVFLLTAYFNQSIVGLYSQAYKAISYPLFLITTSFSPVFFQKMTETKNKLKLFKMSFFLCIILGSILLFPIIFWGNELFSFVFGKKWEFAGSIAKVLCPLTLVSFAVNNISSVFSITQKNHILLIWQIIYLAVSCFIIIILKSSGLLFMMAWFTWIGTFMYLVLALIGYKIMVAYDKESN